VQKKNALGGHGKISEAMLFDFILAPGVYRLILFLFGLKEKSLLSPQV